MLLITYSYYDYVGCYYNPQKSHSNTCIIECPKQYDGPIFMSNKFALFQ